MKRLLVLCAGTALLSGCASWFQSAETTSDTESLNTEPAHQVNIRGYEGPEGTERVEADPAAAMFVRENHPGADAFGAISGGYANRGTLYQSKPLVKHVGDYVQNMTQDLISNMEYLSDKTPVGITHFALLDSDLQQTNLLGYQLAESFIHELHKFRIPVIDYKSTEYIRVTEQGDFILSRDYLELKEKAPLEYVLTGTMAKHQGGYLVNARILGMQSKAVVASAQSLIPFYVVEALLPSDQQLTDGVKLRQGD
ncbi:FlgO family outer membrane protein [Lacimicrobium sp. SS2-24]|uniref:FlgO family outer membrane protein n=1 Tax=Lacimicrobium sp. SS2-24 TaxID=2005569 RepID=UPI000B4BE6C0|nr:FlgO family outer membrane protein [Lacimicrobium sp. SS2-24]